MKNKLGSDYKAQNYDITFSDAIGAKKVACDKDGWTIIQSRGQFPDTDKDFFFKTFAEYKAGFGEPSEMDFRLYCKLKLSWF